MKSIDPYEMVVGREYLSENITNGDKRKFTFHGIDSSRNIGHSLNGGYLPGYFYYYEVEVPTQWVDIPSDVPVRFQLKADPVDWYVGWFDPRDWVFRGIGRGDTEMIECLEKDVKWETL